MIKKIIFASVILLSNYVLANDGWSNSIFVEKNSYSYYSNIFADTDNRFEYRCSVIKTDSHMFGKIDYLNIDLNLKLEEEKLSFQDKYKINLSFSDGKNFSDILPLKVGINDLDRFTFYLSANSEYSDPIMESLIDGDYVNVEIIDDLKKRILYRFYLKGSKNSILKSQNDCELLYETFK